jgi:hypothetical protein
MRSRYRLAAPLVSSRARCLRKKRWRSRCSCSSYRESMADLRPAENRLSLSTAKSAIIEGSARCRRQSAGSDKVEVSGGTTVVRLLAFLALGFNMVMLADAYRRRAETYWLWIIVAVPGGAFLYFFLVRMKDRDARKVQDRIVQKLKGPESLEVLRRRFERSPSLSNRLALAQGLGDAGHWGEAKEHFEAILGERPEEWDAVFGLAVCDLEIGQLPSAIAALERIVERNPTYHDYDAFGELAHAYEKANQRDRAIALLEHLARRSPKLSHVVVLAEVLIRGQRRAEAEAHLQEALRDHTEAPRHVKKEYRTWARRARKLLEASPA